MPVKKYSHYHKDGSLWALGFMNGDMMDGYWEWFRKDGTKMRSGYFKLGKQIGEWTTYDKLGQTVKVTNYDH
jgi:antitoxin component YwqK of YwqJK toxin-antitoxin module